MLFTSGRICVSASVKNVCAFSWTGVLDPVACLQYLSGNKICWELTGTLAR